VIVNGAAAKGGLPLAKALALAMTKQSASLQNDARSPIGPHFDFQRCLEDFFQQRTLVHFGRRSHAQTSTLVQQHNPVTKL